MATTLCQRGTRAPTYTAKCPVFEKKEVSCDALASVANFQQRTIAKSLGSPDDAALINQPAIFAGHLSPRVGGIAEQKVFHPSYDLAHTLLKPSAHCKKCSHNTDLTINNQTPESAH
jgi:hypothetical protein